jgi:chloramphenicol-sensitive protein RarD
MSGLRRSPGLIALLSAFGIWALFPLYWKQLHPVAASELLFIRLILTSLFCLTVLPCRGSLKRFFASWKEPSILRLHLLAAIMLATNWFAFIWAVASGRVLESSLGYFLCPLVSILLGRWVLGEHLQRRQWAAVALASVGVALFLARAEVFPLAALTIAATWGAYGLCKKRSSLGPVSSLGMETSLLSPVAVLGLVLLSLQPSPMTVTEATLPTLVVLAFSGALTAAPLLLFAFAAPRVPLSTIGMGQFIVPSGHFVLALLYGERVTVGTLIAFACIWVALTLYTTSRQQVETQD